jgi:hypothetical protein
MEQTHIGGGMKLRVVPSALSLTLSGGCIPGLIAVTPAPAAAAKSAYAMTDLGNLGSGFNAQGQEHAFLLTQLVSAPRIYRPPA